MYIIGMMITAITGMRSARARGEFYGAIRILEILGMLPPSKNGTPERKKRRAWAPGIDMVKSWFTQKQKVQKEAYAAA